MICHNFFFNLGFKFQDYVCNGCHDLTMLSVNTSDIAIITIIKILIIVVLFITLANLKQLVYYKVLFLKVVGKYKKNIALIFSLFKKVFFYFFCFVNIKW